MSPPDRLPTSPPHRDDLPARPDCRTVDRALGTHERRVVRRDPPRAPLLAPSRPPADGAPLPGLDDVRRHLRACPACARRQARRLSRVEALDALARRELPADSLEDFYEGIRERMPHAIPGGGMSPAFLDAPRSLRVWRATALAASLLLAVGVGFVATAGRVGPAGSDAPRVRPLQDPRDRLLPAFDASSSRWPVRSGVLLHPVEAPAVRGHEAFFEPAVSEPRPEDPDGSAADARFR